MNVSLAEKEKIKVKMLEAMLEYAGSCHIDNIVAQMDEQDQSDEQIPFPPELDVKMRKLIASYNRKEKFNKVWKAAQKVLPRVAIFITIIFLGITAFVMSVEAFRVKVLNFVLEETKEYTSIEMKEESDVSEKDSNAIPPNWKGMYAPTYIPEGFEIVEAQSFSDTNQIIYSNNARQIIVFEYRKNEKTDLRIDTENGKTSDIVINDYNGVLVEKGKMVTIVWHNGGDSFSINSEINKNEIIKIAESVKIAK